jgi:rhodanese-related sulfurtransferase
MNLKKWAICLMGAFCMTGCRTESVAMPEKYLLFDVRTLEEYEEGHLPGAVNIAYNAIRERIHVVAPDKSAQIYLYCHSGRRAAMAQQTLQEMGYNRVVNLGGLSSASQKTQLKIIQ